MHGTLIRSVIAAFALLVFWLLLLGWAAQVSPGQSWSPVHALQLSGAKVHTVFGVAERDADGLSISALGAQSLGLQTWRVPALQASDYGVLLYKFKGLPRNLDVDLIIRTAEHPQDVISVRLPWPGEHSGAINLASEPQWQGTITEIGFSEYANPQLVPPDAHFQPFTLIGASLQQSSWSSLLKVLVADWFGYRSWQQSSINSLDESMGPSVQPMLLVLAIGALGSALLLWLLARVPVRRSLIFVLLVAWLLFDAHWLVQLSERHAQTQAWYAGKPWLQRQHLQADRDLVECAAAVKHVLANEPPGQHVLVWAATRFARGRLGYHLRPLNVRDLPGTPLDDLTTGAVLLIDDDSGVWHYDAVSGQLRSGQSH
ncbi:MAG: hypothetical protein L0H70_02785, partial [Xanthomonadales bacterium]|nr:hypothetical protein [Xanthomonadales bacterium]